MSRIIPIDERGAITAVPASLIALPQDLIAKYGLEAGLILRSSAKFPVEIYSDERVKKFRQQNKDELKDFKL